VKKANKIIIKKRIKPPKVEKAPGTTQTTLKQLTRSKFWKPITHNSLSHSPQHRVSVCFFVFSCVRRKKIIIITCLCLVSNTAMAPKAIKKTKRKI